MGIWLGKAGADVADKKSRFFRADAWETRSSFGKTRFPSKPPISGDFYTGGKQPGQFPFGRQSLSDQKVGVESPTGTLLIDTAFDILVSFRG